jgi:hypothetical protein
MDGLSKIDFNLEKPVETSTVAPAPKPFLQKEK